MFPLKVGQVFKPALLYNKEELVLAKNYAIIANAMISDIRQTLTKIKGKLEHLRGYL